MCTWQLCSSSSPSSRSACSAPSPVSTHAPSSAPVTARTGPDADISYTLRGYVDRRRAGACRPDVLGGLVGARARVRTLRDRPGLGSARAPRARALGAETGHVRHSAGSGRLTSLQAWSDVAHNFRGDWEMLWKEILGGFLIAGYVSTLPAGFFNGLFLTGSWGPLRLAENVVVGPIVAALAFVCSIGNIPLAAVLWSSGISFSGVIAFIYADLIILPIINAYRKYYGARFAALLVGLMFGTMAAAALVVDGLFSALGLVPGHRPSIESIAERP